MADNLIKPSEEFTTYDKVSLGVETNSVLKKAQAFATMELRDVTFNQVVDMRLCRKSPSPGASATKPKYQLVTP